MRLRAVLISLSKGDLDYCDYADILEQSGLKTTDDLLFTSSTSEQYARLEHGSMSFTEFASLKEEVTKFMGAPGLTGDVAYMLEKETVSSRYKGYTGVPELDQLLDGFGHYGVIEIAGGRETCKTLLASHIVLRYLTAEPKGRALWIDTSNSFNVNRALAVTRLLTGPGRHDALDRLGYSTCFDMDPALGVLDDMRQAIDAEGVDTQTPRFIIIDAVTPLLSKDISSVSSQGHAIMTSFFRQLNSFARSYSLTVFVINNSVLAKQPNDVPPHNELSAFSGSNLKPALGPTFTFQSDATIWLSDGKNMFPEDALVTKATQDKVYVAEVLRSRSFLSGQWCSFKSNGLNLAPA
ncbi:hypothetical protein CALCODRAFT_483008 [Calocera cornea HHB12733]|uniref:Rad51-like C-terminal domain-containing protein n=1 Tax=Calocera cornea HHB12733 TaxID=1353952 RepID=A0A165G768_9BASI|nr:hypothetical protein CALCODRAFT_483008 [Calocera cornea HHB12733]